MGQAAADDGFVSITDRASSDAALIEADIERAAAFAVATDDDAENVYAVLAARELAPSVSVIARAASSEAVRRLESAGALRVFSPPIEGALSIVGFVRRPHVSDLLDQLLNPHSTRSWTSAKRPYPKVPGSWAKRSPRSRCGSTASRYWRWSGAGTRSWPRRATAWWRRATFW